MNIQITQITQQVSHLFRGHLPGQLEINPKGHIDVISALREGLEESLVMVFQESITVSDFAGAEGRKNEESLSSNERSSLTLPVVHLYQPPVPYPQRLAWAKTSKLEPIFAHFLDIVRRVMLMSPSWKLSRKLQRI